jgi:hypothetical protein
MPCVGGVENLLKTFNNFSLWNENKCLDLQPILNSFETTQIFYQKED